jgi:hypothetical protein
MFLGRFLDADEVNGFAVGAVDLADLQSIRGHRRPVDDQSPVAA